MTPRPPLDELLSLLGATLAAEGTTTSAGTAAGDNFIDTALKGAGDNSFVSMLAVLYPGQPQNVDSKDITAFDNATGKVTLAGAYKGVAAAIPAGVPYKIVTFRFTPAEVAAIEAKLDHAGHGLAALKTLIDAIETKLDTPATFMADVTALALEATLATVDGIVDDIKTQTDKIAGKMLFSMDFWSLPQEEIAIPAAPAADQPLPSVTVGDLPGGATIVRAIAMFKFRMVENSNVAANKLSGAQEIQIAGSVDAINFVADQFTLAAETREGGDVIIGAIDIATTVTADGAYAFHWDLALADVASLLFNDVQMGIRIWYSI